MRIVRRRVTRLAVLTALLATVAGGGSLARSAQALPFPTPIASFDHRYLAGSVEVEPALDEAAGPLDCAGMLPSLPAPLDGTLGGACFDVSQFPPGFDLELVATDDLLPGSVSMFAGFDADNDGCIGCVDGADPAWESHSGRLAAVVAGPTLAVFVRAVSVGDDVATGGLHLASVGNLHLNVFESGSSPCKHQGGPALGRELDCGEPFEGSLPYPYPCLGGCDLP